MHELGTNSKCWKYWRASRRVVLKAPGEATLGCWQGTNWTTCFHYFSLYWKLVEYKSSRQSFYNLQIIVNWRCTFPVCRIHLQAALGVTNWLSNYFTRWSWLWDLSASFSEIFGCLLSPCFSMYGIMQPRSSAPKEGDNAMVEVLY